jgi:hypothetical protein
MKKWLLGLLLIGLGLGGKLSAQAQPGYFNQTEFGMLVTNQSSSASSGKAAISIHTTNGYRFSQRLGVGAGTGVDAYEGRLLVPLTLALTGDLGKLANQRVVPFYGFAIGHGFDLTKQNDDRGQIWRGGTTRQTGGLLVQPLLGLKIRAGEGTAFTFQCGYRWQTVHNLTEFGTSSTDRKIIFRRLFLGIGFAF